MDARRRFKNTFAKQTGTSLFYKPMLPRPAGRSRSRPAFVSIICHAAREKKPRAFPDLPPDMPSLLRAFIAEHHAEKPARMIAGVSFLRNLMLSRFSTYGAFPDAPAAAGISGAPRHPRGSNDQEAGTRGKSTGAYIGQSVLDSLPPPIIPKIHPLPDDPAEGLISKYLFPPISVYNERPYPGNGEAPLPPARG